jgi:hypothetical protein
MRLCLLLENEFYSCNGFLVGEGETAIFSENDGNLISELLFILSFS